MKFAEIIRNAGLNPQSFPRCADIHINLYDGKDRLSSEESVNYIEPLFKENDGSLQNFQNFLTGFEYEDIVFMNVKVDICSVVLFYKSPRAITFLRNPSSISPIGYVE